MSIRIVTGLLLLITGWSCSTTNTKVVSNPKSIGYRKGERIVIASLSGISEKESAQLNEWANEYLKSKLRIEVINFLDAQYQASQFGLVLPAFNNYDTADFEMFRKETGVDFMLLGELSRLKENYGTELNNPYYMTREAIVSFQLLDLRHKAIVWNCATRVLVNPIKARDATQTYYINSSSGSFAIQKAYNKSIRRMVKSFVTVNP
jgi:hypothetical protein